MKKRLNADKVNVNGKTVNVGIDVHKVSWHVTAGTSAICENKEAAFQSPD